MTDHDDALDAVLDTVPGDDDQYRAGYVDGAIAFHRYLSEHE